MVSPTRPPTVFHGVATSAARALAGGHLPTSLFLTSPSAPAEVAPAAATATASIGSKQPSTSGGKNGAFNAGNGQENDSWLVNTPERRPSRYGGVPFDYGRSTAVTASNASSRAAGAAGIITTGKRWAESEHAPFSSLQQLLRSVEMGSNCDNATGSSRSASAGGATSSAEPGSDPIAGKSSFWPSSRGSRSTTRRRDDDAAGIVGNLSAKRSVKRTIAHCLGSASSTNANLMSPPSPVEIKPTGVGRTKKIKKRT